MSFLLKLFLLSQVKSDFDEIWYELWGQGVTGQTLHIRNCINYANYGKGADKTQWSYFRQEAVVIIDKRNASMRFVFTCKSAVIVVCINHLF